MYLQVQYARRRLHLLGLQSRISMLFLLAQRGNSVVIFALSFHVSYLFVIASLSVMLFFLQLRECLFVLVLGLLEALIIIGLGRVKHLLEAILHLLEFLNVLDIGLLNIGGQIMNLAVKLLDLVL